VHAVDSGSPPRTGSAAVIVTIVPSQKPVFDTGNYVFYVQDSTYAYMPTSLISLSPFVMKIS
jgi:hypothetical protein